MLQYSNRNEVSSVIRWWWSGIWRLLVGCRRIVVRVWKETSARGGKIRIQSSCEQEQASGEAAVERVVTVRVEWRKARGERLCGRYRHFFVEGTRGRRRLTSGMSNNNRIRGAGLMELECATEGKKEEWNTGRASDKGRLASEHRSGCAFLRLRGDLHRADYSMPSAASRPRLRAAGARFGPPFWLYPITQLCARHGVLAAVAVLGICRNRSTHHDRQRPRQRERANHWPCSDRRGTPLWPVL